MTSNEPGPSGKAEPRFYYGYVVVLAAFVIMVVSWGAYNAFGIFFKPLQVEFGWSSAVTSGVFSTSMIVYGILGFVVGGLNDRFGPRIVLTFCGFFLGIGLLLVSQTNALWQIYLTFGVIAGAGMSGVWVPQLSSVARWFVRRRGLMTGIVLAGVGIGQMLGPPLVTRLNDAYGWRLSYLILGGAVLVIMVLIAQLLRRDPSQKGLLPYGADDANEQELETEARAFTLREALATPQFWFSFMMLFCYGFSIFGVIVHVVPHVIELGLPALTGANVLAVNGGVSILGSYAMGALGDRIGNRRVFIIGLALMGVSLFSLMVAKDVWALYLIAAVFGFAMGGTGAAESPLAAWLFGLRAHGLIYGVVHIGFTVGAALGPYLMGFIFDLTGRYQTAFLLSGAVAVLGVFLTAMLKPTRTLETVAEES
ncbi:MFS transporter [Chloroflexota bacterium]